MKSINTTWKKITALCLCASLLPYLASASESWVIDSQDDWQGMTAHQSNFELKEGMATPVATDATWKSAIKVFEEKQALQSLTVSQSPVWLNWQRTSNIGPGNLGNAPVMLSRGPGDYWMFGAYGGGKKNDTPFVAESASLPGFDIPLKTTRYAKQFDAPGGLQPSVGGYHAWQSKDMVNWVHHGPISDKQARWMTTAEYVDGKAYFYYDFPNDQDPHLIIDEDMTDGLVGTKMGMAFKDPSHGSDSAIIRDLEGKFHLILENWDPINAQRRSWDSPLASHAVSPDGIKNFTLLAPAVDERTQATGKMGTYKHPHWVKEDPANYKSDMAEYEIHEPSPEAFGDWAAISIGGQYYLFGDYDPEHKKPMSVAWFTSSDINEPFTFCGNIGKGHPDPDVMFAEGQFYLATQQKQDFVSPGPWVEKVEVRVGVDTNNDGAIEQWSDWSEVKESYDYIPGFAKQIAKTPAQLDVTALPQGYGFQLEVRVTDTTENVSKPILDRIAVSFQ